MKKLSLLFAAMTLLFVSCSKDDDDNGPKITAEIAGTWTLESYKYQEHTVQSVMGQSATTDQVEEAYDINYTMVFSEETNEVVGDGSYGLEITTSIQGQQMNSYDDGISDYYDEGTYEMAETVLTLDFYGDIEEYEILELTASTLKVKSEYTEDLGSGTEVTYTTTTTFSR
ncbi:lipocalin family protein [Mangrovimonas sp. TPBH4]|uniref:lipocalin family protein n=1 Tax=Mangrovimonas sp. TPBH4 TaxID=1645914 RepID=UPI0006B68A4C|nr:lipocalin family protein [Mangrovimonas sp. TPBH4]